MPKSDTPLTVTHPNPSVSDICPACPAGDFEPAKFTFPQGTVALLSERAPKAFVSWLVGLGALVRQIPPAPLVDPRFSDHPDLQMCEIHPRARSKPDTRLVCAPRAHEWLNNLDVTGRMAKAGLIRGEREPASPYPGDCLYNCFCVGQWLVCGKTRQRRDPWETVPEAVEDKCPNADAQGKGGPDRAVAQAAREAGLEPLPVTQGYARCSAIPVGRGCVTEDPSIERALKARGVPVLRVPSGLALLEGFERGFIGGAAGVFTSTATEHTDQDGHGGTGDAGKTAKPSGVVVFCGPRGAVPEGIASDMEGFIREMGFETLWAPVMPSSADGPLNGAPWAPQNGRLPGEVDFVSKLIDVGSVFFLQGNVSI